MHLINPISDNSSALARHIAGVDREIDQLVYQLYGLTAEEITVVEGEGCRIANSFIM